MRVIDERETWALHLVGVSYLKNFGRLQRDVVERGSRDLNRISLKPGHLNVSGVCKKQLLKLPRYLRGSLHSFQNFTSIKWIVLANLRLSFYWPKQGTVCQRPCGVCFCGIVRLISYFSPTSALTLNFPLKVRLDPFLRLAGSGERFMSKICTGAILSVQ